MHWTDRAVSMLGLAESKSAPPEIIRRANDAIQHFVWATDCRHQCYLGGGAKWRNKANNAHYHGKKAFNEVYAWVHAQ